MFVAREERAPLGGLTGLVMPSAIIGALGSIGCFYLFTKINTGSAENWYAVAATALLILTLTLTLTGRSRRWIIAVAVSCCVAFLSSLPALKVALSAETGTAPLLQVHDLWAFLAVYAGMVLAKSIVDQPATMGMFDYRSIFLNAVTLPVLLLIVVMAAGLLSILLSSLYSMLGIFQHGWQGRLPNLSDYALLGLSGAFVGAFIASMRMQRVVIGVVRYTVLLISRFAMPLIAVVNLSVLLVVAKTYGLSGVLSEIAPFAPVGLPVTLLVFFLVYQNGQGEKPNLWLRLSTIIALLIVPLYAADQLKAGADTLFNEGSFRIEWLLIGALVLTTLAGLISEIAWKSKAWMRPVRYGFGAIFFLLALTPLLRLLP